jgi:hypothetical protein
MRYAKRAAIAALLGAASLLSGCVTPVEHLGYDFGSAVKEDALAQVADPDAHYTGDPAPGAIGTRVGLAQDHYNTGTVIKPVSTSTQSGGGGGGGSSGSSPR